MSRRRSNPHLRSGASQGRTFARPENGSRSSAAQIGFRRRRRRRMALSPAAATPAVQPRVGTAPQSARRTSNHLAADTDLLLRRRCRRRYHYSREQQQQQKQQQSGAVQRKSSGAGRRRRHSQRFRPCPSTRRAPLNGRLYCAVLANGLDWIRLGSGRKLNVATK